MIETHTTLLMLLQPRPRAAQAKSSGEARIRGSLVWSLGPGSPPPMLSTPLLCAVDEAQQEVLKIDDMHVKGALLNNQKRGYCVGSSQLCRCLFRWYPLKVADQTLSEL